MANSPPCSGRRDGRERRGRKSGFQPVRADLPEKKTDLVSGSYTLPAPEGETTVAVKIIDMLGEEVLVTLEA